jgi:hypothetical protein
MHPPEVIAKVLALREQGLGARRIASRTGVPLSTVRDWLAGRLPASHLRQGDSPGGPATPSELPDLYVHLLGLYLGDGCLSEHRRSVFKLRLFLDAKYPGIVAEAARSISAVNAERAVNQVLRESNCVEVYSYSKCWPTLFPQHGPGPKHDRRIFLERWQQVLAERHPKLLLRGLIQSDGARSFSSSRSGWTQPRYVFGNVSTDITSIFCTACDRLRLRWTMSFPADPSKQALVYVSRKDDVARMDEFVGPKG